MTPIELVRLAGLAAIVGLTFLQVGCGGGDEPGNANAAPGASTTGVPDSARHLPIAYGLPRVVSLNAYMSRAMVVQAVYGATQMSGSAAFGQITNTGTLAQTPAGWQYAPTPADKLVVQLGGQTHEFVIRQAQGNMQSPTPEGWLMSPHVLSYRHTVPGVAEADINAQFDGQRFDVTVVGWSTVQGQRYDVNLRAVGATVGQYDASGQETRTEYAVTGKVTGNGMDVDVNEQHVSTMAAASSTRLLPSQRGFASRFHGTINSILHAGGDTYVFQNVTVTTDQSAKGGNGNAGVVEAGGQITHNGQPFGACVLQGGQVFLQTTAGAMPLDVVPSGQ
ncbi:MAG: hypothetical protein GC159_17840 [Phycisphaera sp.]|nr:hypothetical protein [Phycisphaera sp.]